MDRICTIQQHVLVIFNSLKGHTVIEGLLRHEQRKMKTPKINTAPPSGLRLNGVCENRKRNSGVKQIE